MSRLFVYVSTLMVVLVLCLVKGSGGLKGVRETSGGRGRGPGTSGVQTKDRNVKTERVYSIFTSVHR